MDSALRVAYVVRYLPSTSETFVLDELASLKEQGCWAQAWALDRDLSAIRHHRHARLYDQAVVVPRPSSLRCRLAALGMEENPAFSSIHGNWEGHGRIRDLRRVAWLARSLRAHAVDVVRVHHAAEVGRHAVAAAMMAKVPVAVAVHARDLFVPVEDLPWILRNAGLVTTVTPFHRSRLLRLGLPSQAVALHSCAVDCPDEVAQGPEGPGDGASGSILRLLSVGRLVPKKGHDLLIEACFRLGRAGQAVQLDIVGEGPCRGELETQVQACTSAIGSSRSERVEVQLLGPLPNEAVRDRMQKGGYHAGVLACRLAPDGDRDGLPVFLLEAQAHGLPVVTSALPGFDYEFEGESGCILIPIHECSLGVEPKMEVMVSALQALVRNPAYRQHLALQARKRAKLRPGPELAGQQLTFLLGRLCGRNPVSPSV